MGAGTPTPSDGPRWERPHRRPAAARLHPRELRPRTIVDAVRGFLDHHMNDWAAALTFYAGISLLPALVIVIGVVGLLGDSVLEQMTENLSQQDQGPLRDLALNAVDSLAANKLNAGIALIVGIFGALWSASSYVGGFMRASGVIHDRAVRYPIWKLRPLQLALTGAVIVAIAGTALFVVITGPLARELASLLGLADVAAQTVLYAVYVETIADYGDLYGSLGAVIGFLIWLWLSNMAMLYGVELNARLEGGRPDR